jgi:SAM-dependent methyltransferase
MSTMIDRQRECPICVGRDVRVTRQKNNFPIARCANCTSEFAVLTEADLPSYDEHYEPDSIYGGYHKMAQQAAEKIDRSVLYWYQHRMLDVAGEGNGRLHLDIGSGLGTFPAVTRSRGWRVRGVDVSRSAADQAKRTLGIETFVGDLCNIDVEPGTVDWISAFEVLEHVLRPREYLQAVHRLLKPGGLLTISVPNGKSRHEISSQKPLETPPTHVNFFARKAVSLMLHDLGFEMIYDYEKPIAWGELETPKPLRYLLLPLLAFDGYVLGHRGNRLLWVGRKGQSSASGLTDVCGLPRHSKS